MTPSLPDDRGRFGPFGGQYVPETLMSALAELETAYREARAGGEFQPTLDALLRDYAGRPTPLYFASRLTERIGGALPLLDPYVEGSYGGAGVTLDWDVAAQVAREQALMLAGGLRPENVAEAVRTVHPWAVDVSSGVETDGVKDVSKIRAFIKAAKGAS